jgi:hypothetical protein
MLLSVYVRACSVVKQSGCLPVGCTLGCPVLPSVFGGVLAAAEEAVGFGWE